MGLQTRFRARTTSDAEVLERSRKIAEELKQNPTQCEISLSFVSGAPGGSYTLEKADPVNLSDISDQPVVSHAQEHDEALWAQFSVSFSSMNVSILVDRYHSTGTGKRLNNGLRANDDEITIEYKPYKTDLNSEDYLQASKVFSTIQKYFVPYNQATAIGQSLGPELAEFYNLREEGLSRLENLTQRIVRETHDYRIQLDTEFSEHKKQLNKSFAEKEKTLEEKYNERMDELRNREEKLEKLRQELDDRTARHARREQTEHVNKNETTLA